MIECDQMQHKFVVWEGQVWNTKCAYGESVWLQMCVCVGMHRCERGVMLVSGNKESANKVWSCQP